jgi:choline dehydrogenase
LNLHNKHFDYIIIGAGSAGCLLANRLSEDPQISVLLMEAGSPDNYPWIHIPVGYLYCINNPRTDWCFKTEVESGLNGRQLTYPRGKTLGGCSSINGMIYMRGQSNDYEHWAELTKEPQWQWQNVLADFVRHEDHFSLDLSKRSSLHHGSGGEWRVEKQRLRWDILDAFATAAIEKGIPATDDFNQGDNFGVGYFHVNQRNGWRVNTAKAFLHPIRKARPNLTVVTHCEVKRLLFSESEGQSPVCIGVELERQQQHGAVFAKQEVILCAGAINSPKILQLSGLGPKTLLAEYGIELVHELPGVGENLQDHLQLRAVYQVDNVKTLNQLSASWMGKLKIAMEYALKRSGPMSMAPSQLGAFARSDETKVHPNLEFHVQPLSLDAFGQPLHSFAAFTASVCNLNPTSRGSVHIQSADYKQAAQIRPNYLSTEEDQKVAVDALRLVREIVAQPALAAYKPKEFKPGISRQSDEELLQGAREIGTTIFHPVGTAKMGLVSDPMAVVDGQLRVHGVRQLRVVDASIMPTITSGNTNSPTIMIAEKAARWILRDRLDKT